VVILAIILVIALFVLFFPIHVWVELLRNGEEGLQIHIRFLRWTLWSNQVAEKPDEEARVKESAKTSEPNTTRVSPVTTPAPQNESAEPKAASTNTPHPHEDVQQAPFASSLPATESSAQKESSTTDRAWVALALHPQLEGVALRLSKKMLRNLFRIFKIRIPQLQVSFGLENPASMGWMMGSFYALQGAAPALSGWKIVPVWDRPGFASLQSRIRIQVTGFRLLRFFASSLWGLLRLAWLGWRLWKIFKRDPVQANLSTWRLWVLNKLSPLISEVQNDQA
jgi:hypothetical protein